MQKGGWARPAGESPPARLRNSSAWGETKGECAIWARWAHSDQKRELKPWIWLGFGAYVLVRLSAGTGRGMAEEAVPGEENFLSPSMLAGSRKPTVLVLLVPGSCGRGQDLPPVAAAN